MARHLWVSFVVLALAAGVASAGPGVNLRWAACYGDGGTLNRSFACNTNTGSPHVMVGSFVPYADASEIAGVEAAIYIASEGVTLPAWWEFKNPGSCRPASLSLNTTVPPTSVACVDWADGQALGGISTYSVGTLHESLNTARIVLAMAVPPGFETTVLSGHEYFGFNLVINNQKSVGTGSCAGCETPVCLILAGVRLLKPVPGQEMNIVGPAHGTDSHYCLWQGGGQPVTRLGVGCPRATPSRKSTWGAVKTLYR